MNKKTILSLVVTIGVIVGIVIYGLYVYNDNKEQERSLEEQRVPEGRIIEETILGGSLKEIESSLPHMNQIQTAFVKYSKGKITFEQESDEFKKALAHTHTFPNLALSGYLFDTGYHMSSKVRVFFHADLDKTRTRAYKVVYGKTQSEVTTIYDGSYKVVVTISPEDKTNSTLQLYNEDNSYIEMKITP